MNIRLHKRLIILFMVVMHGEILSALDKDSLQNQKQSTQVVSEISDLESDLIPLDSIIALAVKNSPYLKYDSSMVAAQETDIKLAKRSTYNYLSGFVNYSTGNQRFLISGTGESNTQNNFLNGYRAGINLTIPLSEFTNKGLRIKREQAELDAQKFKLNQSEQELRLQVTQQYTNLIASQKLLKIKSSGVENARMLYQMAEKQFREGTSSLQEYASVSDMAIKAEVDYELAKASFRTNYYSFQNLVGVPVTSLIQKK